MQNQEESLLGNKNFRQSMKFAVAAAAGFGLVVLAFGLLFREEPLLKSIGFSLAVFVSFFLLLFALIVANFGEARKTEGPAQELEAVLKEKGISVRREGRSFRLKDKGKIYHFSVKYLSVSREGK
jgi:hypothetical protein